MAAAAMEMVDKKAVAPLVGVVWEVHRVDQMAVEDWEMVAKEVVHKGETRAEAVVEAAKVRVAPGWVTKVVGVAVVVVKTAVAMVVGERGAGE